MTTRFWWTRRAIDSRPGGRTTRTNRASIAEVAAADIPPTSHAVPLTNVFRDDEPRPGLTAAQALSGAPESEQQRFAVPRILGDEQ